MTIRQIDNNFAVTGQIRADQVPELAAAGYAAILCARPDNEDPGQPSFAEIALAAEQAGLSVVHIPISGPATPEQIARFQAAMADLPGPVLGYCRSGGRAANLYATLAK
ncbi:hypothetical protein VW29_19860 [Devosia limi DSM 17137]|uniref:TIGR01244 family protein n=1 Tax=Devosia limi DSM 17137 TaxID=1121477 RepID=A0A0F5L1N6_9HYPH|nr:TIGR01244 family sulfur transferase [Devosia limi]KKB76336.1 hypothetical protein VW29_19860 [Devosia limi DSM 17137]SHF72798.1 TIGR01244 family protein [Devosia limi DSM 17137]